MGQSDLGQAGDAGNASCSQDRLRRLERAEEQRDVFVHLSRRLAGATTAAAVTDAVRDVTDQLLGWDFFYLACRLGEPDRFRVVSVIDTVDGRRHAFSGRDLLLSQFSEPVRSVVAGRPLLINRPEGAPAAPLATLGSERPSASLMFVPVRCDDRVTGFLSVQSYTSARYGEADLRILQDIADALAPALERIRIEESLGQSRELLRLERDVALTLSSTNDIQAALCGLLEISLQIEGIDCGRVYAVSQRTGDLELVHSQNLSDDFVNRVAHLAHDSPQVTLVAGAKPIYMAAPELHAVDDACRTEGVLSLVVIPISHMGRLVAVLNLASRRFAEIPADARSAIEAIAAQLGAAMTRIRAEQELREARDSLEQRVQERTAELLDANARLRAEVVERQRTEQALAASEQKYRLLIEMNAIGFVIVDERGRVLDANQEYVRLTGRQSLGEVLGKPVTEWTAERDRERNAAEVRKCTERGFVRDLEICYCWPDGRECAVEISAAVLNTEAGSRILSHVQDISDRKRAEDAVRDSEHRYRTLAESAHDSIFIIDREDRVRYANSYAARQFGCSREQLIGRRRGELFPPEIALRQARHLEQVFSAGVPLTFENVSQFPDRAVWLHTQLVPMKDEHGSVQAVLGISRDVTQMHQATEALRESEARFSGVFRLSPEMVSISRLDNGEFVEVNEAFERITGYSRDEVIGHSSLELGLWVDPSDRDRMIQEVTKEGGIRHFEVDLYRRDRSRMTVIVSGTTIEIGGERLLLLIVTDITERKRAEESLREINERLRALSDNVADGMVYQINSGPDGRERRFSHLSRAVERLHGLPMEAVRQNPLLMYDQVVEEDRPLLAECEAEAFAARTTLDVDLRVRLPSGEIRWRHFVSSPRTLPDGSVVWDGIELDITERKRVEEALKDGEARFRMFTESSLVGVLIFQDGVFRYVNPAMAEMVGYSRDELIGFEGIRLVHPDDRAAVGELIRQRLEGELEVANYNCRLIRKSGEVIEVEALGRRITFEARPAILGTILNITERKEAERALLEKEEKLRQLGLKAHQQLEEERARISRELHDELGQILTALNFNLNWLGRQIGDVRSDISERLDESVQYVGQMIASVRSLSRSLRPAALSHEGLAEAVCAHAAEFEQYSGISCDVTIVPPGLEVGEPLATTVFRVVQEALTNVARHSKASHCQVHLEAVADELRVSVRDNGVGMDVKKDGSRSLGIPGMKERVAMVGGGLTVADNPGGGTCVTATLPLLRGKPATNDM